MNGSDDMVDLDIETAVVPGSPEIPGIQVPDQPVPERAGSVRAEPVTASDAAAYAHSPFARWLHEQLRIRGWSTRTFAYRVGSQQGIVRRWLHDREIPNHRDISRISLALDLSPDTVVDILTRGDHRAASPLAFAVASRDWTPDELAAEVGVDVATVRFWLRGLLVPSTAQTSVLASAVRVPVETVREWLENGSDPGESTPETHSGIP